jgi:hypothetical protein
MPHKGQAMNKTLTLNLTEGLDTLFYDLTSQKHYPEQSYIAITTLTT